MRSSYLQTETSKSKMFDPASPSPSAHSLRPSFGNQQALESGSGYNFYKYNDSRDDNSVSKQVIQQCKTIPNEVPIAHKYQPSVESEVPSEVDQSRRHDLR